MNRKIILDREGLKIYRTEEAPLSEEEKDILIEEISWDDGLEDIYMEITKIKPFLSDDTDKTLEKLELEASTISRRKSGKTFWDVLEEEKGIEFEQGEVKLNGNWSSKKNLVETVKLLVNQGKLSKEDLPYSSGPSWYLLNTKSTHKDENKEMYQPEKISENIYIETKFSTPKIKEKIKEIVEKFGIEEN